MLATISLQGSHPCTDTTSKSRGRSKRPWERVQAALAHQALEADPEIGLLLPCNVTVRQAQGDRVVVGFLDPQTMVQLTNNAAVGAVADDAGQRLSRAREALEE